MQGLEATSQRTVESQLAILKKKYWQAWLLLKDRTAVKEVGRRNQTLELRAEPLEVIPEKAGPKPRKVRFEALLIMYRLRVKLRTDELQKGQTGCLQHSFPHLAGG